MPSAIHYVNYDASSTKVPVSVPGFPVGSELAKFFWAELARTEHQELIKRPNGALFSLERVLYESKNVALRATISAEPEVDRNLPAEGDLGVSRLKITFSLAFKSDVQMAKVDVIPWSETTESGKWLPWLQALADGGQHALVRTEEGCHAYFARKDGQEESSVHNVLENVKRLRKAKGHFEDANSLSCDIGRMVKCQDDHYLDVTECNPYRGFCDKIAEFTMEPPHITQTMHSDRAAEDTSYSGGSDPRWLAIKALRQGVARVFTGHNKSALFSINTMCKTFSDIDPLELDFVSRIKKLIDVFGEQFDRPRVGQGFGQLVNDVGSKIQFDTIELVVQEADGCVLGMKVFSQDGFHESRSRPPCWVRVRTTFRKGS